MNAIDLTQILTTTRIPFDLRVDIKWILELIVPMLLAILGWIFVYLLNIKNMKAEKKAHAKIQAYEYLKEDINAVVQSFGAANIALFLTSNTLEHFTKDDLLYEFNKSRLIEEQDNNSIKSLFNKAHADFIKFIFSWELYEIIFKDVVRERYALQCEFDEIISKFSGVITEYENYILYLKLSLEEHNKSTNMELNVKMKEMLDSYTDFNACIRDVTLNLQDFVFKDIFKHTNQKRKVLDKKHLTIETLLLKHQEKLNKEYV